MNDPINNIKWIDSRELKANYYNPNVVFTPELKSLERNIFDIGYVQPIMIAKDYTIIDGFHRVQISKESTKLIKRYQHKVPCVIFDVARDKAMILTVRMNRAKGSHIAVRMSEMVHELIDEYDWSVKSLAKQLGASKGEVELLYQDGVFKMRNIKNYKYSKAWYPILEKNQ